MRLHTEALAQVHALQACLDAEQPDSERIDPHDEHWLRVVERPDEARGAPSVADYVEGIPSR